MPFGGASLRHLQILGNAQEIGKIVVAEADQQIGPATEQHRRTAGRPAARVVARIARPAAVARAEIVAQQRAGRVEVVRGADRGRSLDLIRVRHEFACLGVRLDVEERPGEDRIAGGETAVVIIVLPAEQ